MEALPLRDMGNIALQSKVFNEIPINIIFEKALI